jgi:hypothetical protein
MIQNGNHTVPHDWAIYGPFDKNVDKQSVAIVQNGEIYTEKRIAVSTSCGTMVSQ